METIITCPLGSECEEIKDNKSYRCRWYIALKGKDPQDAQIVDKWGCAIEFMPMLQIEVAQTNRGQTQALESFRNEMIKGQNMFNSIVNKTKILK
jgi:hypothetical protein